MAFKKTKPEAKQPASPPVAKLRDGLISASIWERKGEKGAFYSVSFERRYQDGEGNWKSSHSYDVGDLLALAKLADQAHTKILEALHEEKPAKETTEDGE